MLKLRRTKIIKVKRLSVAWDEIVELGSDEGFLNSISARAALSSLAQPFTLWISYPLLHFQFALPD
jgi:hypothetical protein